MNRWWRSLVGRLTGSPVPHGFPGELASDEQVLAAAATDGGHLLATRLGLWVPDGVGASRRIGWHLINKATWGDGQLAVVEGVEDGVAGAAVLLTDRPVRRFPLAAPGKVPESVHARVTRSIRSRHFRELPGGGAWLVQRRVPGADGVILQVRPVPGTDRAAVAALAAAVAARMSAAPRES